jgi:Uma2 family endonuclease
MFEIKKSPIHPDYYKYPSTDGEPMAVSTLHFKWLVTIKENLETLTKGKDVFVAGDLLWYPVKGKVNVCKAPDVMVVIGRPKGERLSYLQWHEENMPPQIVFEVFSKTNRRRKNKEDLLLFYEKFGVEEYYSYDPDKNTFVVYIRQEDHLTRLEGLQKWVSPLLNIEFRLHEKDFKIYHPNGQPFLSYEEVEEEHEALAIKYEEEQRLRQAERKRMLQAEKDAMTAQGKAEAAEQKAKAAEQKAEAAEQKAEAAEQKAVEEKQRAEVAEMRSKLLEERLRSLGIDPTSI